MFYRNRCTSASLYSFDYERVALQSQGLGSFRCPHSATKFLPPEMHSLLLKFGGHMIGWTCLSFGITPPKMVEPEHLKVPIPELDQFEADGDLLGSTSKTKPRFIIYHLEVTTCTKFV